MAALPYTAISSQRIGIVWGGVISGIVHDANANPAAHPVFAIHRATGALSGGDKSDPLTGAYSIRTSILFAKEPHLVVEITPGGSQNARAFDNITPL